MASHTKWAGFLASAFASSMIIPAAFKTPADSYIVCCVTNVPSYFQLSVEYLLSCLWANLNYKVFSVSFPSVYKFWLYVPCI